MVKFFVDPGAAAKLAVRANWLRLPVRCVKLCAGVPATPGRRNASCVPPSGGFTTCARCQRDFRLLRIDNSGGSCQQGVSLSSEDYIAPSCRTEIRIEA